MVRNSGCDLVISSPTPSAAAVPWTAFPKKIPSKLAIPARRPPASEFFNMTVVSGPGASTNRTTNIR
jgi:hypothetical protein